MAFLFQWILAFSPIGVVLVLMIGWNWGGGRAGAAGWFTAMLVSLASFGAQPQLLAYSQTKAALLSLNVLYIIWPALLLYNVAQEAGAIESIGRGIQRFSGDKAIQLIIFGWIFSSFLQGVAGYGVPIAVVAPLLLGLGFSPVVAVAVPAIGHCWSVTFGSMGASFQALMAVSGYDFAYLAPACALMLGVATFLCGIAAIHVFGGFRLVRHSAAALLVVGMAMAGTQYGLAVFGMWTLGGVGASLAGMLACLWVARFNRYRSTAEPVAELPDLPLSWAMAAYLILIVVVFAGVLITPLKLFLGQAKIVLSFPEIVSLKGWTVPAENGKTINLFGHGGALLTYATVISYGMYTFRGVYHSGAWRRIWSKSVKSGVPTSIGIVTMVSFAMVMDHCGMNYLLAKGIGSVFGAIYPFVAPWIGLLGAFMTGSNTNSNVVFGVLQKEAAELTGVGAALILAAQTTGGALGSMIAPAKIIVGCSTVGLAGKEGPVLRVTLVYGLIITALIGLLTLTIAGLR
jgi:lactate permease